MEVNIYFHFIFSGLKNHGLIVAYNDKHMVEGICKDDGSCYGDLTWEWKIQKCPDESSPCQNVTVSKLTQIVETPLNTLSYGARANSYDANSWYEITFSAARANGEKGETSTRFFVNEPPKNGKFFQNNIVSHFFQKIIVSQKS